MSIYSLFSACFFCPMSCILLQENFSLLSMHCFLVVHDCQHLSLTCDFYLTRKSYVPQTLLVASSTKHIELLIENHSITWQYSACRKHYSSLPNPMNLNKHFPTHYHLSNDVHNQL